MSMNKKTKFIANDSRITIGVGWDSRKSDGDNHDLDLSLLMIHEDGKCHSHEDFCFHKDGHREVHNGSVIHHGDEKIGEKVGDDEKIDINLSLIPYDIKTLIPVVSIYKARSRELNFGLVSDAYIRIFDESQADLMSMDLSEDASLYTAMEFCQITRSGDGWSLEFHENGTAEGLASIIKNYGFNPK